MNLRRFFKILIPWSDSASVPPVPLDYSAMNHKAKVLFVCMGNICRSPTAHGVFRSMVIEQGLEDAIAIDSAGTLAYHVGEQPDRRAQSTAKNRGVDLSDIYARKAVAEDFEIFDYILAMDQLNVDELLGIAPEGLGHKVQLFLEYAPDLKWTEVPDPYYGGPSGFVRVYDMVEEASKGLLKDIQKKYLQEEIESD